MPPDDPSNVAGPPATRRAPLRGPRPDEVVVSLADDMHEATIPAWEPLTGLQVLFLTTIARGGRVTRTDLQRDCRTSRAAVTPGLASLIHQGFVDETPDGADGVLTVGIAGQELLVRIEGARMEWLRRAFGTRPPLDVDAVIRLVADLEHLRP